MLWKGSTSLSRHRNLELKLMNSVMLLQSTCGPKAGKASIETGLGQCGM
jgi:hypothetical protein